MLPQPAIDTRLRPFEAAKAVRRLLNNPEDTSQVFIIFRAMRGRSALKTFRRFASSATGAAILRDRRSLLATLEDSDAMARHPQGSVGRAYMDFMAGQNLSADGLVQASESWERDSVPPDMSLLRERMRDSHDLNHVLTGYGRDPLGEICLLAFMYAHTGNLGMAMIVLMGLTRVPGPARPAVLEAWRRGRKARWLPGQDFEALLPRPLAEVRRELAIADPVRYLSAATSLQVSNR
jgi:ubiquinone biosynthesis protein COQ4